MNKNYSTNLNFYQQFETQQPDLVYNNPLKFNVDNGILDQNLSAMILSLNPYNCKSFVNEELMNYNCQLPNRNYMGNNMNQQWISNNFNKKISPLPVPYTAVLPIVLSNVTTSSPVKIENNPKVPHNICTQYNSLNTKKVKRPLIYKCDVCNKAFDRKYVLKRHRGTHSENREYHCTPCKMSFYRKDIYDRHLTTKKCIRTQQTIYGPSYNGPKLISKRIARNNSLYSTNNGYLCNQTAYLTGSIPVYNVLPTNQINVTDNYC